MPVAPRRAGPTVPGLPTLDRWMWQLIVGLLGLFVVELVLLAAGAPLHRLAWYGFGQGFAPWQPLTRVLVEGPHAVFGVLISLLVLWFLLPGVGGLLGRRRLAEAMLAALAASTVLVLLGDALLGAAGRGPLMGWGRFLTALLTLYGLMHPGRTIQVWLLFVPVPVPTILFVYGPPLIFGLFGLSALATGASAAWALEGLGIWAGAFGWWHLRRSRGLPWQKRGRRPSNVRSFRPRAR